MSALSTYKKQLLTALAVLLFFLIQLSKYFKYALVIIIGCYAAYNTCLQLLRYWQTRCKNLTPCVVTAAEQPSHPGGQTISLQTQSADRHQITISNPGAQQAVGDTVLLLINKANPSLSAIINHEVRSKIISDILTGTALLSIYLLFFIAYLLGYQR